MCCCCLTLFLDAVLLRQIQHKANRKKLANEKPEKVKGQTIFVLDEFVHDYVHMFKIMYTILLVQHFCLIQIDKSKVTHYKNI